MNIEKTISEQAVSDILTPMLESQDRIVTEDVAPLFDQATGLDTPPASGTVTTTIEESRSVITAIIRKAWTAPLTMLGGASVIGYITAAYTYLRNRLQGNETYGIPDRRSEISASSPLAANLALLNDRKISGVPEAEDGMSFVRVLMDSALGITELTDDNIGWSLTKAFPFSVLSSLQTLTLCFTGRLAYGRISSSSSLKVLNIPYATDLYRYSSNAAAIANMSVLEEINGERVTYVYGEPSDYGAIHNCPNLKKLKLGKVTTFYRAWRNDNSPMANLIHLEFGQDTAISLDLSYWNPTYALDPERVDLIEEGSTAQNNLQQFLENFRDYIALRLADNGSDKTLTLSQAVHNAITAAEDDYHIREIITQKGWTISPAPN